ncbi:hypothetical protein A1O3_05837 [Capronia epimyces CBS 606.96]|uniref:Uncharacterized protein n=1 Tax=Capronia epimyces CBS 606.96 TaxID=1182542 RepID=W9XX59_9EURO|nr:uncharacterized protein A1O3_05837 [Capronia epimyces CBS 606.96]EXJ85162.1 hypothetical protein A1O3_05837 [Capronia epimyces CBS 606.96]
MAIPKRSLSELMQTIKANIKRYRAEQASLPLSLSLPATGRWHGKATTTTMMSSTMEEPEMEFTSRTADQEVCAVEICPDHPEYMVIGTYSLVKKDERRDYEAQTRRGTLQVMPVAAHFQPKYAGMLAPHLDRVEFPCAVLDLHFHPADGTLLGVAASNAQMYFFRLVKHGDVLGRRVITKLLPLGTATIADPDDHGLVPLVTQFAWLPETRTHGVSGISDVQHISVVATTSLGHTRLVDAALPAIKDLFDERVSQPREPLSVMAIDVHQHDLEAWTVAAITLPAATATATAAATMFEPDSALSNTSCRLILSGGDDSALIASVVETPADSDTPAPTPNILPLWKDRRAHTAGVVAILPLASFRVRGLANDHDHGHGHGHGHSNSTSTGNNGNNTNNNGLEATRDTGIVPLITGSYDEFIRLYELDGNTYPYRATLKTERRLDGGVWRLKVLDQYDSYGGGGGGDRDGGGGGGGGGGSNSASNNDNDSDNTDHQRQSHTLILASLMHGGAAILRLTYTYNAYGSGAPNTERVGVWSITPLVTFRAGHESMVYCCDARLEIADSNTNTNTNSNTNSNPNPNPNYTDVTLNSEHDTPPPPPPPPPTYTVVSTSFYDMKICTWTFVDRFKADCRRQEQTRPDRA